MKHIRNSAFTIVELLVVLSIIALVSGIGLAILSHSGRQFGFEAVRGEIVSLIRYTRSNAVTEKGTTTVVVDPLNKQVYSCARRTVGLWHFEDVTGVTSKGAFNNNATLEGDAEISPYGRYGYGLSMTSTGYAKCGKVPIVSRDQGISVECWIFPKPTFLAQRTIVDLTNGGISLEGDDSIRISYGSLSKQTASAIIGYNRWTYVVMLYEPDYTRSDGNGVLSLYLNNILVEQVTGNPAIIPGQWDINVGGPGSFSGVIDEVKVSLITETDRLKLEPDISIWGDYGFGFQPLPNPVPLKFDRKGLLIQTVPLLQFRSASTNDSFILEVTLTGTTKIR